MPRVKYYGRMAPPVLTGKFFAELAIQLKDLGVGRCFYRLNHAAKYKEPCYCVPTRVEPVLGDASRRRCRVWGTEVFRGRLMSPPGEAEGTPTLIPGTHLPDWVLVPREREEEFKSRSFEPAPVQVIESVCRYPPAIEAHLIRQHPDRFSELAPPLMLLRPKWDPYSFQEPRVPTPDEKARIWPPYSEQMEQLGAYRKPVHKTVYTLAKRADTPLLNWHVVLKPELPHDYNDSPDFDYKLKDQSVVLVCDPSDIRQRIQAVLDSESCYVVETQTLNDVENSDRLILVVSKGWSYKFIGNVERLLERAKDCNKCVLIVEAENLAAEKLLEKVGKREDVRRISAENMEAELQIWLKKDIIFALPVGDTAASSKQMDDFDSLINFLLHSGFRLRQRDPNCFEWNAISDNMAECDKVIVVYFKPPGEISSHARGHLYQMAFDRMIALREPVMYIVKMYAASDGSDGDTVLKNHRIQSFVRAVGPCSLGKIQEAVKAWLTEEAAVEKYFVLLKEDDIDSDSHPRNNLGGFAPPVTVIRELRGIKDLDVSEEMLHNAYKLFKEELQFILNHPKANELLAKFGSVDVLPDKSANFDKAACIVERKKGESDDNWDKLFLSRIKEEIFNDRRNEPIRSIDNHHQVDSDVLVVKFSRSVEELHDAVVERLEQEEGFRVENFQLLNNTFAEVLVKCRRMILFASLQDLECFNKEYSSFDYSDKKHNHLLRDITSAVTYIHMRQEYNLVVVVITQNVNKDIYSVLPSSLQILPENNVVSILNLTNDRLDNIQFAFSEGESRHCSFHELIQRLSEQAGRLPFKLPYKYVVPRSARYPEYSELQEQLSKLGVTFKKDTFQSEGRNYRFCLYTWKSNSRELSVAFEVPPCVLNLRKQAKSGFGGVRRTRLKQNLDEYIMAFKTMLECMDWQKSVQVLDWPDDKFPVDTWRHPTREYAESLRDLVFADVEAEHADVANLRLE
uniref:RING-type domain-containing protein n=1 Tax=Macrostomum lignano TaxID=282301 RepID=A0A1I8G5R6_9PLAT